MLKFKTEFDELAETNFNILALEALGSNLTYLSPKNVTPSVSTIINVAHQVFEILEELHTRDIIHRDIKPANFVLGTGVAKRQVIR